MSFDPSTNCIVTTYFSGSVNIASTNSQSLISNTVPTLLIQYGQLLDKRLWNKLDTVFKLPGLDDAISVADQLVRKIIRPLSEITSISEVQLRKPIPGIPIETISILESKLRKFIPIIATQTTSITDFLAKNIKQTVSISEKIARKVIRSITETTGVSEMLFGGRAAFLNETVGTSGTVSRLLSAKRNIIEGMCSILFNGLSLP